MQALRVPENVAKCILILDQNGCNNAKPAMQKLAKPALARYIKIAWWKYTTLLCSFLDLGSMKFRPG